MKKGGSEERRGEEKIKKKEKKNINVMFTNMKQPSTEDSRTKSQAVKERHTLGGGAGCDPLPIKPFSVLDVTIL